MVPLDRTLGLRSILDWVLDWEATAYSSSSKFLATLLDSPWLERRLEHFKYELPFNYVEHPRSDARVLAIGEAEFLAPVLQRVPGRIPKAAEVLMEFRRRLCTQQNVYWPLC